MGNDRHVPNVLRIVHETTDLAVNQYAVPDTLSLYRAGQIMWKDTYLFDREAGRQLAKVH